MLRISYGGRQVRLGAGQELSLPLMQQTYRRTVPFHPGLLGGWECQRQNESIRAGEIP